MNLTVKCPSCGGVVVLNPKTRQLQCTQCDSVISRGIGEENSAMVRNEDGELVDKRSYKAIQKIARIKRYITDATDTIYTLDEINIGKDDESPRYMDMNLYECTSCGARLMVKSTETSSFCAYCGQPMILVDRVKDELEPDLIIPFGISQKRAEQLIRDRFCKGWFVPDEIKKFEIDKIRGIYIPYWLASYHVRKKLKYVFQENEKGECVSNYEKCFGSIAAVAQKTADKTVTHNCMRDCECTVPRVPGDATRRLNDHISARLEPYDLEKALTFSPEYLSGFYTDRYDVPAAEIAAVAKRKSNDAVKEEMMSDVPKNARITEEKTNIKMTDIEYALLPAWFMTFRYQGILYTVAVNGQTGKVVGNVPSNRFKVGASIAILMTVMVVLCTYVSVFVGGLMTDLYRISADVGDSSGAFMVFSAYVAGVIYSLVSFWRAINKLHRSRIDIHRFRSYGTIEYVKERQDKTWVR